MTLFFLSSSAPNRLPSGETKHPREDELRKYIEYIINAKYNHILVVAGAPGTGKTYLVRKILNEMGVEYTEIGDPTPEGLFEAGKLYSNLSKKFGVLVLNETTLLSQSKQYPRIIHLLNQMGDPDKRIVARPTKRGMKNGEKEIYEFIGKIIIIVNDTNFVETRTAEALRSRMTIYEMNLEPKEILELMKLVATKKFGDKGTEYLDTYLKTLKVLAEEYRIPNIVEIGLCIAGVRRFIRFAELTETAGKKEALKHLIRETIEDCSEYWDAYTLGWDEFSKKHPEISKSGWKYRRHVVQRILHGQGIKRILGHILANF